MMKPPLELFQRVGRIFHSNHGNGSSESTLMSQETLETTSPKVVASYNTTHLLNAQLSHHQTYRDQSCWTNNTDCCNHNFLLLQTRIIQLENSFMQPYLINFASKQRAIQQPSDASETILFCLVRHLLLVVNNALLDTIKL